MTEMSRLALKLMEADIPFEVNIQKFDVDESYPQIIFYDDNHNRIGDVICNSLSDGHEDGLLELMGLDLGEKGTQGYLTADLVFDWILDYLSEHN